MRTVIFVLVGLVLLTGVGATTVALWPSADGEPIESILVEAPRQSPPVPPAQRETRPTIAPVAPPVSAPPPPVDVRGVPDPPPAVSGGGAGWQDDDGDDGDSDDDDGDDD